MEYIVNVQEMQQGDANTIKHFGIQPAVLMERAALQVVEVIKQRLPQNGKILIVAGTGNNGGDGLAVGRILALQKFNVEFVMIGNEEKCSEETSRQLQICRQYHYEIMGKIPTAEYAIVVDAIFGIGLNRKVEGAYCDAIETINRMSGIKISVDIPSGIHAENGKVLGIAVRADSTITFAYKKVGQLLYPGAEYCGTLLCRDIGITEESFLGKNPLIYSYQTDDIKRLPKRNPAGNKGSFGKILLVAGSVTMSGACILSGLSAYRTGAGLIRIFTPEENRTIVQKTLPESIITTYDAKNISLQVLEEAMEWAGCIAVGPGLGTTDTAAQIVRFLIEKAEKPMVIDADALNLLAANRELLMLLKQKKNIIMTPHLLELARLTCKTVADIKQDIIACADAFAREYQVMLVCKDARTICCDGNLAEPKYYMNQSGNDGMATAGSGDVLVGMIVGLVSQGMPCNEAATLGVYLHGLAGDRALAGSNRYSLIASDIIEALKYILRGEEKHETL